jgi:hypothetical protein
MLEKEYFSDILSAHFIERLAPFIFLLLVLCIQTLLFLVKNEQALTEKRTNEIEREDNFYRPNIKEIIKSKPDVIAIILLSLSMAIFIWMPISNIFKISGPSDYREHIRFAVETVENKIPAQPHFFYHLLIVIVQLIPGVNYSLSSMLVVTTFFSASSIFIYFYIRPATGQVNSVKNSIISLLISISLLIVTPIFIFTLFNNNLYRGYIGISTYHNPTINLLKTFAILVFLYTMNVFREKRIRGETVTLVILIIFSTLTKPNYTIALLPAIAVFVVYRIIKKRFVKWKMLIFGIGIPSVIVLGWQYFFYFGQDIQSNIIFSPFQVYLLRGKGTLGILANFILSIAFPLCVYVLDYHKARRNFSLNFSWLVFLFGSFYSYFLAQGGKELGAGNFFWSAQIALFILFLVSAKHFIDNNRNFISSASPKRLINVVFTLSIFGLHLFCGIYFYYWHLTLSTLGLG